MRDDRERIIDMLEAIENLEKIRALQFQNILPFFMIARKSQP